MKKTACIESEEMRKKLISRVNRIGGQVRGIEKMIENKVICDEILNQISSVKSALNGMAKVLIEIHLRHCVIHNVNAGYETEAITTLTKLLNNYIYKSGKISEESNEKIIKKIEKQISQIRIALDGGECCSAILKIIASIKCELNGMAKRVLEGHINGCILNGIKSGDSDELIDNFIYSINKMIK